MVTVHLKGAGDGIHFRATNASGYELAVASSADERAGVRPMEMVAMSLGGCSSIDILSILEKQRHSVEHFDVRVEAQRDTDDVPAVFTALHVHYRVEGDVPPGKLRRAIDLSLSKYCSVARMLEKTAPISYVFTLNGQTYAGSEQEHGARHGGHSDAG